MDITALRNLLVVMATLMTLGLLSCNADSTDLSYVEDCENYNYKDCNTIEPIEASLFINFSISSKIKFVSFEVYKGYVDDNNLYFQDTSWNASMEYQMPVNEYWSVKATYHIDGKTIKVIDGGNIKVQSAKVRDSTCWSVNNLVLNAIIK